MRSEHDTVKAGDLLNLTELRALRRTSSLRGVALVVHAWTVIGGAMLLYTLWPSLVTLVVAVVVIGGRQIGLMVLMHEAAHWLLPLATWLRFASRLRSLAEHGLLPHGDEPLANARTTRAGLVARALLAPYWVNYHLEHHLMVFVPCWRLPAVHARLLARGHRARMALAPSYVALLRLATTSAAS